VQASASGKYSVTVTNLGGATNSAVVALTVGFFNYTPVGLTAGSYNQDMIVEKAAANGAATTATVDDGTANGDTTWFETGFIPGNAAGLPVAGSTFTSAAQSDHSYAMAPSYTNKDTVLIDSGVTSNTVVLTTPAAYTALSVLDSSGHGAVTISATVHHANNVTETASFTTADWFDNTGTVAFRAGGRVNVNTRSVDLFGSGSFPFLHSQDLSLVNVISPVTSIDLAYSSGSGHACLMAVSGSTTPGGAFTPIAITGYNKDVIIEAAQQFTSGAYTTASVDGGTANTGFGWHEMGYAITQTGVPGAGATFVSQSAADHSYAMAPSFTANDVAYVDGSTGSTLTPSSPTPLQALSFLTGAGYGPENVDYSIHYADGTSETGTLAASDWFSGGTTAWATHGRINVQNGGVQIFGNGTPWLYSEDVVLTNTTSAVTGIDLTFGSRNNSSANAEVFALSGITTIFTNMPTFFTSVQRNANGTTTLSGTGAGNAGFTFQLQFATNLVPPVVWQTVGSSLADTNGVWRFTDASGTNSPTGFYRAFVGQ
jgi:hypothetical protein